MRFPLLIICLCIATLLSAQSRILLDEDYSDWQDVSVAYNDPAGDSGNSNIDFGDLWISHDEAYVFFRIEVGTEMNLQTDNEITIYIDADNNSSTGVTVNGIGAEIVYNFGNREGNVYVGNNSTWIGHNDIGMTSLPTVTSDQFEIAIARALNFFGQSLFQGNTIKVVIKNNIGSNTDRLPDGNGGVPYTFNNDPLDPLPTYSIDQAANSQLRILSYNVLFDNLFENNLQPYFSRIISSINPDIIGFQEIYDHNASQTAAKVEDYLPSGSGQQWYHSKIQPDIITVSRFPIIASYVIGVNNNDTWGNGAFLIELDPTTDTRLLFIVAHTPCCDNNYDRQREIDAIMAFVRDAKDGSGQLSLAPNDPIVIAGDMNLVGDNQQQSTLITGDILNQSSYGPDFNPDWDGTALEDAKPFATNLPMAITWYQENSSFAPGRLDYMVYTGSVLDLKNTYALFTPGLSQTELVEHSLGLNDVLLASDHLPIVSDFDLDITIPTYEIENDRIIAMDVFPNPFQLESTLSIQLSQKSEVLIELFDLNGQQVALLYQGEMTAGRQLLNVTANNLSSGLYICRMQTEYGVVSQRVGVAR